MLNQLRKMLKIGTGGGHSKQQVPPHDEKRYQMVCDMMGVALWEMDIKVGQDLSMDQKVVWPSALRRMLGFISEREFPNILGSLIDRMHPDDRDMTLAALEDHLYDYTDNTF